MGRLQLDSAGWLNLRSSSTNSCKTPSAISLVVFIVLASLLLSPTVGQPALGETAAFQKRPLPPMLQPKGAEQRAAAAAAVTAAPLSTRQLLRVLFEKLKAAISAPAPPLVQESQASLDGRTLTIAELNHVDIGAYRAAAAAGRDESAPPLLSAPESPESRSELPSLPHLPRSIASASISNRRGSAFELLLRKRGSRREFHYNPFGGGVWGKRSLPPVDFEYEVDA